MGGEKGEIGIIKSGTGEGNKLFIMKNKSVLKGYVQARMGRNQRTRIDGFKKKQTKKKVKTGTGVEMESWRAITRTSIAFMERKLYE